MPYDYDALYMWATTPPTSTTWRFRGQLPAPEAFPSLLWGDVLTQFAIVACDNEDSICGLVQAFNHDATNRFVYLSVVVGPAHQQRSTAAGEGIALIVKHLFDTFDLRKIYVETTAVATVGVLRIAETWPFVNIEGVLTENQFHEGRFIDVVILAIDRARFQSHRNSLDRLVQSAAASQPKIVSFDEFAASLPRDLIRAHDRGEAIPGGALLGVDLGVDSLGLVELIAWVEDRFNVAIPDGHIGELLTLQDLFAIYEVASGGAEAVGTSA